MLLFDGMAIPSSGVVMWWWSDSVYEDGFGFGNATHCPQWKGNRIVEVLFYFIEPHWRRNGRESVSTNVTIIPPSSLLQHKNWNNHHDGDCGSGMILVRSVKVILASWLFIPFIRRRVLYFCWISRNYVLQLQSSIQLIVIIVIRINNNNGWETHCIVIVIK